VAVYRNASKFFLTLLDVTNYFLYPESSQMSGQEMKPPLRVEVLIAFLLVGPVAHLRDGDMSV
jgi:hypothetical protein